MRPPLGTVAQRFVGTVRRHKRVALAAGLAVAVIIFASMLFIVFPVLLVSPTDIPDSSDRASARNDIRATGVQLLGVLSLIAGGIFTARTFQLNREGQITERFSRAIEQLGSEKLDVRLGGIYSLERIAFDSRRDHAAIMEVLTAYVRRRAPWPSPDGNHVPQRSETEVSVSVSRRSAMDRAKDPTSPAYTVRYEAGALKDVQAAMRVLQRRRVSHDVTASGLSIWLDLRSSDLRYISVVGGDFRFASFNGANLEHAELNGCDFARASFVGCNLRQALMISAKAQGADFHGATLAGCLLAHADLRDAGFEGALLGGEGPQDPYERWVAESGEVTLGPADLSGAELTGARYDEWTTWAKGFDVAGAGALAVHPGDL